MGGGSALAIIQNTRRRALYRSGAVGDVHKIVHTGARVGHIMVLRLITRRGIGLWRDRDRRGLMRAMTTVSRFHPLLIQSPYAGSPLSRAALYRCWLPPTLFRQIRANLHVLRDL